MPGQPGAEIRGIGNWLRHAYDRIDVETIWLTVQRDIPPLREAVREACNVGLSRPSILLYASRSAHVLNMASNVRKEPAATTTARQARGNNRLPQTRHRLFCLTFLSVFAILFFALVQIPETMERTSLDWSWKGALTYFQDRGFHFGSDVLYTYGPLGYMMNGAFVGGSYAALAFGKILYEAVFALTAAYFAVRLNSWIFYVGLIGSAVLFARYETDYMAMLLIIMAALLCVSESEKLTTVVPCALAFSFISLVKFTFAVYSFFSVCCVLVYLLLTHRRKSLWPFTVSYAAGFLFFWTILGRQRIGDIPAFFRGSWEVAYGFSQTMRTPPVHDFVLPAMLLMTAFAALLILLTLVTASWQIALVRFLVFGAGGILVWNQGFVRADSSHIMVVPLTIEIVGLVMACLVMRETRESAFVNLRFLSVRRWVAVAASLVLWGAVLASSASTMAVIRKTEQFAQLGSVPAAASLFMTRVGAFLHYAATRDGHQKAFAAAARTQRMPMFSSLIRASTVDVFGDEVGIAILNGWNYQPRPTVQSFAAYTSYLERRNEAFVTGKHAPEFYVLKSEPIDERLFPETDGKAFRAILTRYQPIATENGFWLFKKRPAATAMSPVISSESAGTAALDQQIQVPPLPSGCMDELNVSLRPRLRARLLLKQPRAVLKIQRRSGSRVDVNLPLLLGRLGFVVNPAILSDLDLYSLLTDSNPDPVQWFAVSVPDEFKPYVRPAFTYRLRRIQNAVSVHSMPTALAGLLKFSSAPYRIETPSPPRMYAVGDQDVFFVHAPSQFLIDVPADAAAVTGGFGVMPGAFTAVPQQKDVTFQVTSLSGEKSVTVLDRAETVSETTKFRIGFAPGTYKTLRFSANCTPTCDGGWSYWTGIRFKSQTP